MRKLNITIVVGLVVALLGFAMVFTYGTHVDARVAEGRRTVPVLVATSALPAGASVAQVQSASEVRQVPAAYVAQGALSDLKSVATSVLLGPVAPGAQLAAAQFGTLGGAAAVQPAKGRVALAIGVALTPGVARYIGPGSLVDVFVTYAGTGGGAARTKLFASGVGVLSVSVGGSDKGGATASDTGGQVVAVLDLSPGMAEKVVNATTLGQVYLALAAKDDGAPHKTEGVTPSDVLGSNE